MPDHVKNALAGLKNPEASIRAKHFKSPTNFFLERREKSIERRDKAAGKKFIMPKNARGFVEAFPTDPGHTLHAMVCGDFVMGDILPMIDEVYGPISKIRISTLSLSIKNCEKIAALMVKRPELVFSLVISDFFQNTNGKVYDAILNLVQKPFGKRFRLTVQRTHAKIFLFETPGFLFCIETSANLRSSNNQEQAVVNCDPEVYAFYGDWMEKFFES